MRTAVHQSLLDTAWGPPHFYTHTHTLALQIWWCCKVQESLHSLLTGSVLSVWLGVPTCSHLHVACRWTERRMVHFHLCYLSSASKVELRAGSVPLSFRVWWSWYSRVYSQFSFSLDSPHTCFAWQNPEPTLLWKRPEIWSMSVFSKVSILLLLSKKFSEHEDPEYIFVYM